ncbi:MAG: helix-hairpin-helix domain-containing protein [Luminiphilus sp.]|nr:helix-hairpin-helix domain-containing protein [Luminiphilus sp.]
MKHQIASVRQPLHSSSSSLGGTVFGLRQFLRAGMMSLWVLMLSLNAQTLAASEPVNINLANAQVLAEALHGVGLTKASRIVEYREAHGPFEQVEELAAVQGIGLETVERNRDVIRLQ